MGMFAKRSGQASSHVISLKSLLTTLAAVLVIVLVAGSCSRSGGGETAHGSGGETVPVSSELRWANNVLMANPADVVQPNGEMQSSVFRTDITREEICCVIFLDTLEDAPQETVDVSAAQDGSVLLWTEEQGELYHLFIAGEGGVAAPEDCTQLFAYYTNADGFYFNR